MYETLKTSKNDVTSYRIELGSPNVLVRSADHSAIGP